MVHPNGLAFSPREEMLYVSDTGVFAGGGGVAHIRRYPATDQVGQLGAGEWFATVPLGVADGLTVDEVGRVWASAGDGVYVYEATGALIDRVAVPETVSNPTLRGVDGHDLYITAASSLYRIRTVTRGANLVSGNS